MITMGKPSIQYLIILLDIMGEVIIEKQAIVHETPFKLNRAKVHLAQIDQ
jgi:hypothetical protein